MDSLPAQMKKWHCSDEIRCQTNEEMAARGWNLPTAERGDEFVQLMEHHKRKTELERDERKTEFELDRYCEMFSLLMN